MGNYKVAYLTQDYNYRLLQNITLNSCFTHLTVICSLFEIFIYFDPISEHTGAIACK